MQHNIQDVPQFGGSHVPSPDAQQLSSAIARRQAELDSMRQVLARLPQQPEPMDVVPESQRPTIGHRHAVTHIIATPHATAMTHSEALQHAARQSQLAQRRSQSLSSPPTSPPLAIQPLSPPSPSSLPLLVADSPESRPTPPPTPPPPPTVSPQPSTALVQPLPETQPQPPQPQVIRHPEPTAIDILLSDMQTYLPSPTISIRDNPDRYLHDCCLGCMYICHRIASERQNNIITPMEKTRLMQDLQAELAQRLLSYCNAVPSEAAKHQRCATALRYLNAYMNVEPELQNTDNIRRQVTQNIGQTLPAAALSSPPLSQEEIAQIYTRFHPNISRLQFSGPRLHVSATTIETLANANPTLQLTIGTTQLNGRQAILSEIARFRQDTDVARSAVTAQNRSTKAQRDALITQVRAQLETPIFLSNKQLLQNYKDQLAQEKRKSSPNSASIARLETFIREKEAQIQPIQAQIQSAIQNIENNYPLFEDGLDSLFASIMERCRSRFFEELDITDPQVLLLRACNHQPERLAIMTQKLTEYLQARNEEGRRTFINALGGLTTIIERVSHHVPANAMNRLLNLLSPPPPPSPQTQAPQVQKPSVTTTTPPRPSSSSVVQQIATSVASVAISVLSTAVSTTATIGGGLLRLARRPTPPQI